MSMSKQDFIALADAIREHGAETQKNCLVHICETAFTKDQLEVLAKFCGRQNSNFNYTRWLDYIAGECGPNGGAIKRKA